MNFQKRMKERRNALNLTLLQVAEQLGVSEATVQRYESGGIKNLKHETVTALSGILKCSPAYLMGWDEDCLPESVMAVPQRKIPMLGKIHAGEPTFANEEHEFCTMVGDCNADFCLRVNGDSMIGAGIKDGDIVFFRSQDVVEDGEIAAVIIDDEATLKRVYHGNNSLTLVADNPKYKPMIFTPEQGKSIRIIGKAVSYSTRL